MKPGEKAPTPCPDAGRGENALKRRAMPRGVRVRNVSAKSILTSSRIPGVSYALNPYVGCAHACRYCYVRRMQRFFQHQGHAWGAYVDVKENAARLLLRELQRKKKGRVMLSSATDCYQPLEQKIKLTRACLELLADARFPVSVLTKSALVVRDLDLLENIDELEVGMTVTTGDDKVRRIMEPHASPIPDRLLALGALKRAGIPTYAFVGPVLPMDPAALAQQLEPLVDYVYFDRMNYPSLLGPLLRRHGWDMILDHAYVEMVVEAFARVFGPGRVESVC